jgi:hypothetical protein
MLKKHLMYIRNLQFKFIKFKPVDMKRMFALTKNLKFVEYMRRAKIRALSNKQKYQRTFVAGKFTIGTRRFKWSLTDSATVVFSVNPFPATGQLKNSSRLNKIIIYTQMCKHLGVLWSLLVSFLLAIRAVVFLRSFPTVWAARTFCCVRNFP